MCIRDRDEATLAALADENALSRQAYLQALAGRYPAEGLKSGDTGESVRDMQSALRELGYYEGEADGVFGDGTRRAVMAFQTANGLAATGEADRAMLLLLHEGQTLTWQDFIAGKLCQRGDSGVGVRSLQRRLKQMGYYEGECTDAFGAVSYTHLWWKAGSSTMLHDDRGLFRQAVLFASEALGIEPGIVEKDYYLSLIHS